MKVTYYINIPEKKLKWDQYKQGWPVDIFEMLQEICIVVVFWESRESF